MRKWGTIAILGLVGYFAWRKFGGKIRGGITTLTS